jgi:hypothetical protein
VNRRDRYGCGLDDDACLVDTFAQREEDAAQTLAINAARIEQTRSGTPAGAPTRWRLHRSPSNYDR